MQYNKINNDVGKHKKPFGIKSLRESGQKYVSIRQLIEEKFKPEDSYVLARDKKIYDMDGNKIEITNFRQPALPVFVMDRSKKVEGMVFDARKGELLIRKQHLKDVNLDSDYFKSQNTVFNFLYEKSEDEFHPVKFVLRDNRIKDFDVRVFNPNGRCDVENNLLTGVISGFHSGGNEYHKQFLEKNKIDSEIGFEDCVFVDYALEDKTIIKMTNTTAQRKLEFKDCTIKEVDFFFAQCPLVQFLGKNTIEKITNIYNVNDGSNGYLTSGTGVSEVFFSNDSDITDGTHSAEEKQYFFKQIRKLQERNGDRVQALLAYQRYLDQELDLQNLRLRDKAIIWTSRFFGGGLDYVSPAVILVIFFIVFFFR